MTLERRLEKAANNQEVLDVIAELVKRSETAENALEALEKKVEALEEKLKGEVIDTKKPGFFD